MIPYTDPVVVAILKTISAVQTDAGSRVSTVLATTLPAIRIALLYDINPDPDWRMPVYQIETWATDDIIAGRLANTIFNAWNKPGFRGTYAGAFVNRTWSNSGGPRPLPDPGTSLSRSIFEGALFIGDQ